MNDYLADDRLYIDAARVRGGEISSLCGRKGLSMRLGERHPDVLAVTQWSPDFELYMRNRLIIGALRYGLMNAPGKPRYDRVRSMLKRIKLYSDSGNSEHLVDIANEAMLEFAEPSHPHAHWAPQDGSVYHTEIKA